MASPIVEAFSVSHAAILNGTTGAEAQDVYGVRDGTLEVDASSFNNTGDDQILSVWNWFDMATLTITTGFIPWDMVALLTGAVITSSGVAPNDYWNMPLWNQASLNQPRCPVLLRSPSKTAAGVVRSLDFVLYSVQFQPIKFDGPTYKGGLTASFTGMALMSTVDEAGNALTDPAIGRLVSRPRITQAP